MRPEYRRYGAIHQACYHGDVEILREMRDTWSADMGLHTKALVRCVLDAVAGWSDAPRSGVASAFSWPSQPGSQPLTPQALVREVA